ncbi:MAG: DUF1549 domain-containing protein, partial [Verrucomicrobia bacterium]|nr:DUF1549 domain-containing protein [Verrucomicrobiota bacterium]
MNLKSALLLAICAITGVSLAGEAVFFQAYNLNGPATVIEGRNWLAGSSTNLTLKGKPFENQSVALRPTTAPGRAQMLRSSIMGDKPELRISGLPEGEYQIVLYIWEDTQSEQYDVHINKKPVAEKQHTGVSGSWRKLGPWLTRPQQGAIEVSARCAGHSAINLSGVEIWSGSDPLPAEALPRFVETLTPEHSEFFEKRIRPLLVNNCYECHKAGARKVGGALLLDSRAGLQKGGDNGPVLVPGDPDASLLIQAVKHVDAKLTMPPEGKLSSEEIADLERWIRMGAPDPRTADTVAALRARESIDWTKAREWWSFRPLSSLPPPSVKDASWGRGDLGRFLLNRMESAGLKPAPPAEKRQLLRRASFDLIGLPPSAAELEAFLEDESPDAFARVIDRLLSSPGYGERWGRHWLDVVRYADTAGDNSDFPIPQMHKYRDWVIEAFNRGMPYDQFVREQLAGDLMPDPTTEVTHARLIATGYIANSRRFGSRVEDYPQHLTIEDTIDNVGRSFLGLTVSCARCHDHKFDPIAAADYYALYGIFGSTRYPWPGIELEQKQRDLIPLVEVSKMAEADAARESYDREKRKLEREVQKLKDSLKDYSGEEKKKVEAQVKQAEQTVKDHVLKGLPFDLAYAVTESRQFEDARIQAKGDPAKPGDVVRRGFLRILGGQTLSEDSKSSGRLELAGWITDPTNPLTARVMVNRIWLHHFGKGLVPTPNDFGKQGKPPTHPELLDWLAARFIASGWSIKQMHRTIMLSAAYQLSSVRTPEAVLKDPGNDLLSAFPR